jgi:hypothetical protein
MACRHFRTRDKRNEEEYRRRVVTPVREETKSNGEIAGVVSQPLHCISGNVEFENVVIKAFKALLETSWL